ncbi:uncharacterized protein LOC120002396 isoform X2 [Tripterygium wilfordii]|uniref:uncharacterized protein LOC120002396 isoform X2 n=1 Tax=Tripterygium wilfordii TaxID=458696 RepID=UPI0018F86159|nr:uncharacterized protein LOC120002396 isoform X2 [Tripterygium wilfordii]
MQVLRWRNLSQLRNTFLPGLSASSTTTHFASIHSTPSSFDKSKNKPNAEHIRFVTRQKRADTKKALKDLLFKNGASKFSFPDEEPIPKFDGANGWDTHKSNSSCKKGRPKVSARRSKKSHHNKMKRKFRDSEEFDDSETTFQETYGKRWYTWSFRSWNEPPSQSSTSGFEWRDHSNRTNHRTEQWANSSESEDEFFSVGSSSDRTLLGLPPKGPLKIEDVKNAFRSSALKWHPDKHQGPSQAAAEEKFKLCVNAYRSLCNALA